MGLGGPGRHISGVVKALSIRRKVFGALCVTGRWGVSGGEGGPMRSDRSGRGN